MLNLSHKKLDIWKLSIELTKRIYCLTEKFPKSEIFGLTNQMRRASVSIASNISEGCSRTSGAEKKRFIEISRSSLVEIDTQLIISKELCLIDDSELEEFDKIFNELFAKLTNFILKL